MSPPLRVIATACARQATAQLGQCFHSPCYVDGPYGSQTFSVVRCPLYEMAMGSGGTMTVLSIAASQWWFSAIAVYSSSLVSHLRLRFASFRLLCLSFPSSHAHALCYLMPSFYRLSVLCVLKIFFFSFCGGYSVSGEGARRIWLWIACSRCGPVKGLRFGFLALGLGIGRDGTSASPTPVTQTGMCLATPSRRRGCTGRK
ncbi:hypothetical protein B0H13DRAFT_2059594, partial [Mycena leptocephala]